MRISGSDAQCPGPIERGNVVGLCAIGAWLLATTVSAVQESPAQVPPAQPPASRTPDIQTPNTRSPAALTIDACALLVPGEIATVIGLPVKPGVRRDAGLVSNGSYSSACVWEVDAGTSGPADPQAPLQAAARAFGSFRLSEFFENLASRAARLGDARDEVV